MNPRPVTQQKARSYGQRPIPGPNLSHARIAEHLPFLCCLAALTGLVPAQALQLDETPKPLTGISIPVTPGLLDGPQPIVTDQAVAIQLGKALFWDMNVGSDGMACATCHFHAGSDPRTRNQLNPGSRHLNAASAQTFEPMASGSRGGVNYELRSDDFPLFRLQDPSDRKSKVVFSTDDVISSSGAFLADFQSPPSDGGGHDVCQPLDDPIFHSGSRNTRRVTTRNAPTVINAAFNFRNFWDGRANNLFNGESAYGPRDPKAGVWELKQGQLEKVGVLLPNASLASQAVAPPLDDREMSCQSRSFPALARKLLQRRPLDLQAVHPEDSVLAALRHPSGTGLNTFYADLIRKSFAARYWSANGSVALPPASGATYTQMEANFAFFFALAIQLYESTLISDQTPFDSPRDAEGYPRSFNAQQKRGLILFNKAECDFCHRGPTLSGAAHPAIYSDLKPGQPPKLVDRRVLNIERESKKVLTSLMDAGFANTSVVPTEHDPGLGARDPMGYPLSFSEQYVAELADSQQPMIDPVQIPAFNFSLRFRTGFQPSELIAPPLKHAFNTGEAEETFIPAPAIAREERQKTQHGRLATAVAGSFKVPTLRNVELTGPYMHNGGMKSLEEVIEFYDRGGNANNAEHFGTFVFPQHFTKADKADLLAFLLTLTDERVRWERAPFDHPALEVPHGLRPEDQASKDDLLHIPAVGRFGRSPEQGPLGSFASRLLQGSAQ